MTERPSEEAVSEQEEDEMPQLGKRYVCEACGTEILCNKPGSGTVGCCGKEMQLKEAKPLPSSD